MAYGLCDSTAPDRWLTADAIVAQLDPTIPLQNAHIASIRDLQWHGCRYCNEDFDVLTAARRAIGKTEIASYEARWVDVMNHNVPAGGR